MPTKKELEADLENQCKEYIENLGGLFLKVKLENERGFPDRLVILDGRHVFFEFKIPDGSGEISPHQKIWATKLRMRDAEVYFIEDYNDFVSRMN